MSDPPKRRGDSPYLNRYLWAFNGFMAGWTTAHPVSCICSPTTLELTARELALKFIPAAFMGAVGFGVCVLITTIKRRAASASEDGDSPPPTG